jgi:hypothetical protein
MTVRTAGLAVAVAVVLWLSIARRRGAAAVIAGTVAVAALPWFLRGRTLDGNSYVQQLLMVNPYDFDAGTVTALDLVRRVGANVVRYAGGEVGVSVYATLRSSAAGGAAGWIASVAVIALAVYGLRRMPRHGNLIALVLGATFGMLLLWPAPWSGARFLHGIVPLVIVASLVGLVEAAKRGFGWRVPTLVLLALPVLFLAPVRLLHQVARMDYPPAYAAFFRAADWVRANTPPDAVVCVRKPYLFHWRSGRACDLFPYTAETQRVIEALERMDASIVIVDRLGLPATARYLVPAVAAHVPRFETVTEATEELVLVLRFVDGSR